MTKFVQLTSEGFFAAGYAEEVHGVRFIDGEPNPACLIPADAIEVTDEQWQELVTYQQARKLIDGEVVEYTPPPPLPSEIAAVTRLSARQLRIGLVTNGIALSQVEAAINAITDPQAKAIAEIEWDYASSFERAHPLINQVSQALGLTADQVDTMWLMAANL